MRHKWMVGLIVAVVFLGMIGMTGFAQAQELGWIPMDPAEYEFFMAEQPLTALQAIPASYDWRDLGAVTPAKNQANCGSCWSFSATGAFEAHIKILFDETLDLAEQKLVSCYSPPNLGCCGGYMSAIRFYESEQPLLESCYPYGDGAFFSKHDDCPPYSDVACSNSCSPVNYNTTGFYTIKASDSAQVKSSIYQDGPAPVAFTVYSDFRTYWNSPLGTPPWTDGVYFHNSGAVAGGHAVLAFGWDDSKNCYLIKNSWGLTGPFGDGTFKMRYDQIREAVNFVVVEGGSSGSKLGVLPHVTNPKTAVVYNVTITGGKGLTVQAGDPYGATDTVLLKAKQKSPNKKSAKQNVLYSSTPLADFCAAAVDDWDTDTAHSVNLPDFTKGTVSIKVKDTGHGGYPKNALVKFIAASGTLDVKVKKGTETCRVSVAAPEAAPGVKRASDPNSEVR